jgi:hypothetical protein
MKEVGPSKATPPTATDAAAIAVDAYIYLYPLVTMDITQLARPGSTFLTYLPRRAVLALRGVMMQNIRSRLHKIRAKTAYQRGTQIAHLRDD